MSPDQPADDPSATGDNVPAAGNVDVRHDEWPLEGYDEDTAPRTRYLGAATPGTNQDRSAVVLYDEDADRIVEATVDEENQRLVPRSEADRDLGEADSIGEALEALGDRLDVTSLSSFARDHFRDEADDAARPDPETVTFTQSNVGAHDDHDLEFTGSHTYRSEAGQVYVVERSFVATFDDPDDPTRAAVNVDERLTRAEEPAAEDRRGDAELLNRTATSFSVDLDPTSGRPPEAVIEERCREWHESRPDPMG